MADRPEITVEEFEALLASAAQLPANVVTREKRLVEDLGLDSLTLAEVVVVLIIDLDMQSVSDELAARSWVDVTVGELYAEYITGKAPPANKKGTIRL